jgi:Fe-S-cluster containining protein
VPEDIIKLSRSLNISESDLVDNYLVKVPIKGNGPPVHALAPAKKKGRRFIAEPGSMVPEYYIQEKGRCIFLDENDRCSVHAAKPFECGAYMGCRNTFLGKPYRAKAVEELFYKRWRSHE